MRTDCEVNGAHSYFLLVKWNWMPAILRLGAVGSGRNSVLLVAAFAKGMLGSFRNDEYLYVCVHEISKPLCARL